MTTNSEAMALRMCLCCSRPGAQLLRAKDGRAIRICDHCLLSCDVCYDMANGAVLRRPIGREAEWVPVSNRGLA